MSDDQVLVQYLRNLPLTRLGEDAPAGLCVASLPIPRQAPQAWSLDGQATHVKPIGQWHGQPSPGPRRLLLAADAGGTAPEALYVTEGAVQPSTPPPTGEMITFAQEPIEHLGKFFWERSLLKISWGGRWFGLAMGMRVKGEVHWWEACNIVVRAQSSTCLEVEMAGSIPHELMTLEELQSCPDANLFKHVHVHNWLSGNVYARLHANGVCEIFAHHINSMFVDDGGELQEAVPVIGLRTADDAAGLEAQCGAWDGSRTSLNLGDIAFDLTDVAHLATPEKPGQVDIVDGFLVLQPYLGMEWHGGPFTEGRLGDPWFMKAEQQTIPRGFARTLRFSASLNPARSPRVARYLAPAWWYGVCEELMAMPLLPVNNEYDVPLNNARAWYHKYMIPAGYEEGILPNQHTGDPAERTTPAAEGDLPGEMFQMAYRTGDPRDYDCATRSCFAFLDVMVDHATKRVRMQGYPPPTNAFPLQRMQSGIFSWLETGDPYCINTAQAVMDTAYWWHKNSWPRRAMGRDARFLHSLVLLYRYLNDERSLIRARDVIGDLGVAQWEDGSFGDQGGGAGIHGWAAYFIKPWMGWMATLGVLDYLEVAPDDAEAEAIVVKFIDWLMSERAPRPTRNGDSVMGWMYMHTFHGKEIPGYTPPPRPTQGGEHPGYHDYLARLLPWRTLNAGDPQYFDAFAVNYAAHGPGRTASYWEGPSAFLFLPWLQSRLWNARLTENGVEITPQYWGEHTPASGILQTPDGPVTLTWTAPGELEAPVGIMISK